MAFGAHLRSLASLNFQKTSLSWRVVADTVSNLTGEEFEPQTSRTDSNCAIAKLGVSVKSVHLVAGRLGFYSQSGHTKDFKNSIRSFRARRSAQAEVRRVLCMCCSSCYVP